MDTNEFDDFFAAKPNTFSEKWKIELAQRFERLKEKNTRQYLGTLHDAMIQEMLDVGKRWLRGKFSNYKTEDLEDISQDGFIKWHGSFNAAKSATAEFPEHHWFLLCTSSAQIDWYHKQNPTITTNVTQLDENGNPILDDAGKEMLEKIRATFVSFPDNSNNNSDDESEESEPMQKAKSDSEKINELAADETTDIKTEEEQSKLIKLAGKRFSEVAGNEIMKYYLLSKRIKANEKENTLPPIKAIYKPLKKSISYQVKPEFDNMSDVAINALNRLQYLKNAEKRKWMEMAISEMRKSKEKLEEYVAGWNVEKQNQFRKDTPVLSSVILNKDGKFVASCFKGKINRTHPDKKEKDVTFDNHCEFSLFTDIIKEENLHVVRDGILYVTLEPCNKRSFWLDGGKETPKIPCAVRCLEAGLNKVFIGSIDDNNQVKNKGKEILESGKYTFKMKYGKISGETHKEIKEEGLLEAYFTAKKYLSEDFKDDKVYTIGTPVEVHDFEPDLIEEVRKLNSEFFQGHSPDQFRL
jgi:pyrimidine deaminase RibD-like protein/DNA-directed RNA polymerase specialized sigma24 family protein